MEVKSRSVSAIEYVRICGVALLHRRHFEYRHMQLSYLNKALLLKLYGIFKKMLSPSQCSCWNVLFLCRVVIACSLHVERWAFNFEYVYIMNIVYIDWCCV